MKKMLILLGIVSCFAIHLNAKSKSDIEAGVIMCGKKKLVIIDAAATWNVAKKEMQIYFFPFKLNSKDLKAIKSGNAWTIGFRKKSPDRKLWPSWCPKAQITINFTESNKSLKSASFCNFMFFALEKNNYTANLNRNGEQVQKSIQKIEVNDKKLLFISKNSGKLFKVEYSWDLSVSCPIFEVK